MTESVRGGWSLLDEAILRVRDDGPMRGLSLPEVLAALGAGAALEFVGLRAHQQHAWHAFLVQLGAMALHRAGLSEPAQDAAWWRSALVALADGQERAWWLLNEQLQEPAFMQPPVPEGTLEGFGAEVRRGPDEIDVLITAKNHDVKALKMVRAAPEQWVYALVSTQTMGAFGGRSWYGIVRMNGGSSSRPALAATRDVATGSRFRRDVSVALASRDTVLGMPLGYSPEGGIALLWLEPWNGRAQLPLDRLDPFFIEVCRRMRVVRAHDGALALRAVGSTEQRLAGKDLKGNTGDLWTPVHIDKATALTASARSFHYTGLDKLLFGGEYRPPAAQKVRREDGARPYLLAQVLVGGNCTSDGYRERWLPLPPAVVRRFGEAEGVAALGAESKARVAAVEAVRRKVLRPALLTLLQGAPDKRKNDDKRADPQLDALDREVDAVFFDRLFGAFETADNAPEPATALDGERVAWIRWLLERAEERLEEALRSASIPAARRIKAQAVAESVFHAMARREFPSVFAPTSSATSQQEESA
jgi:CRISPR system Cascade subunit CasA